MKKKHILFLASWYPSRVSPYNGDFIQRHAHAAALKNQITVLYVVKDNSIENNFEITDNKGAVREITVYYKGSPLKPLVLQRKLKAFKKGLKIAGDFDIVHLNVCWQAGIFALYLKSFFHKKYVLTEHWTGLSHEKFITYPFYQQILIRQILKNAEMLLPVSKDLGKNMLKIAPDKRLKVIPNVVDTERFLPKLDREKNDKTKFLHLSMLLDEQKNISGMLRVAQRLAGAGYDFEFHIGGNGPREWIDRYIKENHLERTIKTFASLEHDKVPAMMTQFDCFVLFSNYETLSCVRIESFSSGIPVVASDIGGLNEFFPENFGLLVQKENEDALFKALESIIKGKKFEDKKVMHQYVVNHFSPQVIAREFERVYEKVLSGQ